MKRKRAKEYRGRIAPSPSGHLHVGHARTFWIARERAKKHSGKLILRVEDIDIQRCKPFYLPDMVEDLKWFGIGWDEGYDASFDSLDPLKSHVQSKRFSLYAVAWKILYDRGYIYPCKQSRRDVEAALSAPHDTVRQRNYNNSEELPTITNNTSQPPASIQRTPEMAKLIAEIPNEAIFPPSLRPSFLKEIPFGSGHNHFLPEEYQGLSSPFEVKVNWRFRVPDDFRPIRFVDGYYGEQVFFPGEDFGDFLIWRLDGYPSYELAVVVDDILMQITEVVRGQDLLISTARQLLLMQAIFGLDYQNPQDWNEPFDCLSNPSLTHNSEESEIQLSDSVAEDTDLSEEKEGEGEATTSLPPVVDELTRCFERSERYAIPSYYHLPLVCDENGVRLAKRNFAKSLRNLREEGMTPDQIREKYFSKTMPI